MFRKPPRAYALRVLLVFVSVLCLTLGHGIALAKHADDDTSHMSSQLVFNPFENEDAYSTVLYNNANGLPTSEANAIVETSEGFIWIGSYAGLIRYDGNNFERMDSSEGIASVVSLYVDSQDRLWIGTNDSGMAMMHNDELRFFAKADGLDSASVRDIAEDPYGNIYAATTKGITVVTPDMRLYSLQDERLANSYVSALRLGTGGLLYGITREGAAFIIDEGRIIAFYTPEDLGVADVVSILPDPDDPGMVYFGTKESTIYHGRMGDLSAADVIDVSPLSSSKSRKFLGDLLWVCADNGIGAYDGTEMRVLEDVPLTDSVDLSMADYEGNLWFTSSRQGVMKIVPNQFFDLFDRYDLEEAVVNSTCMDEEGNLFIGADTGLTVVDETGAVTGYALSSVRTASGVKLDYDDLTEMLDGIRIRSVVRDSKGVLWLATYGPFGMIRLDEKDALCFTVDDGMPSDRMRTAIELSDGRHAVACTGGAVTITGDEIERVYTEADGIENIETLTVAETEDHRLVLGSDGDGITVLTDGEKAVHIGVEDGLSSDVILRIKPDVERDILWLITSNSISYLDHDLKVTTVRHFPYSNNFDLFENELGEVWVLSSNGIYVTTATELVANGPIETVFLSMANGLPCIATANSYSGLDDEGNLYIAGTTGVARVNIDKPFKSVSDVKLAVPFVEADDTYVYPDESGTITVPASTSRLKIHPFVFTYSLMDPRVTYYLDGFEQAKATTSASDLVPADYTNLRGGEYHFIMKLSDAMGHGYRKLDVKIMKELALTEEWWFRIVSLVGLAIVSWFAVQHIVRLRTARLLKKQEEDRLYIREMGEAFAHIIDMKDKYTSGHSSRVAKYTRMLTEELGYDEDTAERYYNIALLHDIGKIGIDAEVLNKPGRLTDEEFEVIKSHTTLGYDALKGISIMPELAVGAWTHHERPDGRGYPQGLRLEDIPRVAQIIAVADCFDAMYSDRPYRKRMNFERVVSIISEARGTQLTEDVVDAFLSLVAKGKFRASNDHGGGTFEDIDNIHRGFEESAAKERENAK